MRGDIGLAIIELRVILTMVGLLPLRLTPCTDVRPISVDKKRKVLVSPVVVGVLNDKETTIYVNE